MPNQNPLTQFIQMMRNGGNPQQMIMNMLQQQAGDNPIGQNLLKMAQNNDGKGIEQVARNLCAQRGLDFDKEFAAFKQQLGL